MLLKFKEDAKEKVKTRDGKSPPKPLFAPAQIPDNTAKSDTAEIVTSGAVSASQILPQTSRAASNPPIKKPTLVTRLKGIKNIEIYAAALLIIIMIAIYLTTLTPSSSSSSLQKTIRANEDEYARQLETKLVSTLSQIKGAGKVDAMVTVVGSATIEIAYNIDEKTITQTGTNGTSNTTTTIVKTPVILNGSSGPQPLILLEIKPRLKGVVIVARGAGDIGVRLQLLRAVQTLISDSSVQVEIFSGK